jgi:outer membrane protein assembly factor BamD (BamD/ComL family)
MLKARKKLTKQELKHDPLMDTLEKGKDFIESYKQQIYMAAGAAAILILVGLYWINSVQSTNNEAMLANTKATLAASQGINDAVISELEGVVSEYGSNKNISQSILQLGMAKLSDKDYSGARMEFEKLANSSDTQTKIAGKLKLAYLAEQEQDFSAAAAQYAAVAKISKGLVSKTAKLQSANAYYLAGNMEKAASIVDELLATEPVGTFKENVEYLQGKVLEK